MNASGRDLPRGPNGTTSSSRRVRRRRRGQAVSEFALVLPIFLLLMLALFDAGRVVYAQNAVAEAAREAVRIAVVSPSLTQPKYDSIRNRALSASIAVPIAASSVTGALGGACLNGANDATAPGTCFYPDSDATVDAGQRVVVNVIAAVPLIMPIVSNILGGSITVSARSEGLVQCNGC